MKAPRLHGRADRCHRVLGPLPPPWRQTVTFDNGTEFARHYDLHALNIETFFCDTYAPWQKGGIENAIVTAGGDSRLLGDRRGRPWIVGIRDPRDSRSVVARLPLVDEAISTSGDYERFFEENGE